MKSLLILLLTILLVLTSCHRRRAYEESNTDSYELSNSDNSRGNDDYREERSIRKGTKVYMEKSGGVYFVPITVNGLDLKFIFDTGASSICISAAEAAARTRPQSRRMRHEKARLR